MKCLTVLQPWAWAIVHGDKRVENRSWATAYRGPLLIHAGKGRSLMGEDYGDLFEVPTGGCEYGAVIGVAVLADCVRADTRPTDRYAFGPWCWVLSEVRPVGPVPCRGALGLWTPPAGVIAALGQARAG